MDLTCLTNPPPIPTVPKLANESNIFVPEKYNPGGGGLAQAISASLARSTFSIDDVRSLIDRLFNEKSNSWSASEVVKIKPVPSIIIYTSIALAIFLTISIVFCVISCRCSCKYRKRRQQLSKRTRVLIGLLIVVYLLAIGDMIYVAYRVNKARVSIDDAIKTANRDIYPRAIGEHVEYLTKEIDRLDRYTVDDNSILINASRSMLVQAFDKILTEKYFIRNISETIQSVKEHFQELRIQVNDSSASLSSNATQLFDELEEQNRLLLFYIQAPIEELCNYTNGMDDDIDQKLLDALDVIHVELKRANQTMQEDILNKITPWEENMLLDKKLEEDIRNYINIGGIVFMVLVILLGVIPLVFFCLIFICRMCGCCQNRSDVHPVYMMDPNDRSMEDYSEDNSYRVHKRQYREEKEVTSSKRCTTSGVVLCLIRIAFFLMIIFLVLMTLVTGVYYALDLAVQGTCRSLYDDQPYLINVLAEQLTKSNVVFGSSTEMNKTIKNIIDDCGDQTHFSRNFLDGYWSNLTSNVESMMETLDERIYDDFVQSIKDIDIAKDLQLLARFAAEVNNSNISNTVAKIQADYTTLDQYFAKINSDNSSLPQSFVQPTADRYKNYTINVLESTIDACPLPLSTVSKGNALLCHTLAGSISGLWLSVFIFMILVTFGCCIFGICVYKRLIVSMGSISSASSAPSISQTYF